MPSEDAPIYLNDLESIKRFAIRMIDADRELSFDQLQGFLIDDQLWTHMNQRSPFDSGFMQLVPVETQDRIIEELKQTFLGNLGDTAKFGATQNGYCLLLGLIMEIEKSCLSGVRRP